MKLLDRRETIVVVVGGQTSGKDRAVAMALHDEINQRGGALYRRAVVVADEAYLGGTELSRHPTIAVGGPGVNAVAAQLVPVVPTMFSVDEQAFVQADFESQPTRVVLWGMTAASTAQAVEMFTTHGVLAALLDRIWGGDDSALM
ncbi:MAG: hypothetical protein FJ206_07935 [Gemmatimonadetes bacterium]|nr:hypothetical protein [Gemmatimonadota bacterium]